METVTRRELAINAVQQIAFRHGIGATAPTTIKDSNNAIVDLGTTNLVAKVATSTLPSRLIDTEFIVLAHLHHKNAPTGRLSDNIDHGPHDALGCRLFFVERLQVIDTEVAASTALDAVLATHDALADLALPVPYSATTLTVARTLLDDPTRTAALPEQERTFCLAVGSRLREELDALTWEAQVLHGDPWIGGNLVNTNNGL